MANRLDLPLNCPSLAVWERCYAGAPPTLNTLRRTFTALVRWAFSSKTREDGYAEELGCLVWDEDPTKAQLQIQAASVMDPGDTEQVPGILISCGKEGVTFDRPTITSKGAESPDTAAHYRNYLASAKLQFVCKAFDADVACMMSDYLLLFLSALEARLRETFGWLMDYKPVNQTEPTMTQKAQSDNTTRWYESVVTLDIAYSYSVFVARESKRLKDFTMEARVDSGINS